MHDEKTLIAASLCAAVSLALAFKWRRNRGRPPYPPGPKGYPLIGNILDLPKDIPIWQAFIPLARKFSEFSFCFFFQRNPTEDSVNPRHGRAVPQAPDHGFRCSEQHRGYYGFVRETIQQILRSGEPSREAYIPVLTDLHAENQPDMPMLEL